MAYYARIYYPADGSGETSYTIPFQYLRKEHVAVYYKTTAENLYEDVLTEGADYTWASASQLVLAAPNPADRDLLIRRDTPIPVLTQQQPGVISSARINLSLLQRQYVDEELYDRSGDALDSVAGLAARVAALEAAVGVGVSGLAIAASEVIAAGDFVNIHNSGGTRLRKAVATDPLKWACGFVTLGGVIGQPLTLNLTGLNSAVSPGALGEAFLSTTTPGKHTLVPPSADGTIIQPLGLAIPGKGILFTPQQRITL